MEARPLAPTPYQVHLPRFEGPFDLLLYFIERDEIDVCDIPIARITDDFLHYLQHMEANQIEVGSEFIAVAAQLMKIKARMLLPRPVLDDKQQPIDPRAELADRLREYQHLRQGHEVLAWFETEHRKRYPRTAPQEWERLRDRPRDPADELQGLTLFGLLKVYQRLLLKQEQRDAPPRHVIQQYPYTVEGVRAEVLDRVKATRRFSFTALAEERPDKLYLIFGLLSILELAQQRLVRLTVGEGFNNFWVEDSAA